MQTLHIQGEAELPEIVSAILTLARTQQKNNGAVVVALEGDLGAGKTTLSKALARELGVTEIVTSPTYVVMKRYDTQDTLFAHFYHIDAYRIEDSDEMRPLRFGEVLQDEQALICIEWASHITSLLPTETIVVTLAQGTQEHDRIITIN